MKRLIIPAAAWLEIITGVSIIAIPDVVCRLLFGATPSGVAILLARFAGVALLGLGVACLPSKITGPSRSAVLGLLTFNVGTTIFLVSVAFVTAFRGPLLWPAIFLHAAISVALMLELLAPRLR